MQSEEKRGNHRHKRIVHLEVREVIDPLLRHPVECAGAAQRQQRAAVAVRRERKRRLRREQQLAVAPEGRHRPLGEKENLIGFQTEETVVVQHIVTDGTIDEQILRALKAKDKTQSALIAAVKANLKI